MLSHREKRGEGFCRSLYVTGVLSSDSTSVHSDQGSHGHCYNRSSELRLSRPSLYLQPTSEWWVKFGTVPHKHTHTRTNTACPSVPTHLRPSLSLSVISQILSLLSLSRIISIVFSVLLFLCWCFPSHTFLTVSLPLIVRHAQCRGELTRFLGLSTI
jgi:hypothetical protein